MRHRVYGKKLGRDKNARTSLFKNLVRSLLLFEKIETTETKAKAIKGLVDKIINQAKSVETRRLVSQFLDKKTTEILIQDITPRLKDRTSGYTSIIKLGRRLGDNAPIVRMSLLLEAEKESKQVGKPAKKPLIKSTTSKVPAKPKGKIKK